MTGLPANISHGTVTGKLLSAEQTPSSDADIDAVPLAGTVTFTPSIPRAIHPGSPAIFVPRPVTVTLDGAGAFTTKLIATDDPDLNPTGWTYEVSFALTGAALDKFSISVPSGGTVDLATLSPVPASNGTFYLVAQGAGDLPVRLASQSWMPLHAVGAHVASVTVASSLASAIANAMLVPVVVHGPGASTIDAWGVNVVAAGTDAGVVLKAALYRADRTLVADLGSVDVSTTGLKTAVLGSTFDLDPGIYLLAIRVATGGTAAGVNPAFFGTGQALGIAPNTSLDTNNPWQIPVAPGFTSAAAWPSTLPTVTGTVSSANPTVVRASIRKAAG